MYAMNLFKKNFMKRMAFAAGILPFVFALLCFSACRNDEPNGGDENKTPPAEVTGLNGIVGDGRVTLSWTDPADEDFTKVVITSNPGNASVETGKGAQTAVITGLSNDVAHTFIIKTVDVSNNESDGISAGPFTPVADTDSGSNGRYLVLYCSRTGNTGNVARQIQAALDCDMLEVEPETPYENDYNAMLNRARQELNAIGEGNYPPVKTSVESFDGREIIFIGHPVWHGSMATPMQTFLHNHAAKLAGKRIALFATSGSSGISTSLSEARQLCPEATFTETLHLTSNTLSQMETRVTAWLDELGASREADSETIKITVGSRELTATLAQNSSAEALKELLKAAPLTIHMRDYGNMEKVGGLGRSLPTNDERITTAPGDLILYQGNALVIYYAPNTWTFTRLGKINGVTQEELKQILGEGDVTVTLSLN
jgi:flavodoxin